MRKILSPGSGSVLAMLLLAGCAESPTTALGPDDARSSAGAEATQYSGRATVVHGTVAGQTIKLVDTGEVPVTGGALEASLLELAVPGVLDARVGHASTVAQGKKSRAEASVADLTLTVADQRIGASFLKAQASAVCNEDGTVGLSGRSHIAELTINGTPVTVTGEVNQRVPLIGVGGVDVGYIVINEQTRENRDSYGAITVNALHVVVPGVADVVIASAHADIGCARDPVCAASDGDFVTGGGWIATAGRKNFGVGGGIKNNGLWGHLAYIDHAANIKAKGLTVTDYEVIDPTTRRIAGTAEVNGTPGTFEVIVSDRGEPGRSDTFWIRLHSPATPAYAAEGVLEGGNIQLHGKPCK